MHNDFIQPLNAKIIVQPTQEPLTLDECRQHLNIQPYEIDSDGVGTHPDDMMIMAMQSAAREYCENFTGLSIAQKTYEVALDQFPRAYATLCNNNTAYRLSNAIELPYAPLISIESITVGEGSDNEIDASEYIVDDYSLPARIVPVSSWPTVATATNIIKIRYIAGYENDSDGDLIPYALKSAILLILGHYYANREDATDKTILSIPNGAEAIMRPLRIRKGMA